MTKPAECKCSFRVRMVGDGCTVCNPEKWHEYSGLPKRTITSDEVRCPKCLEVRVDSDIDWRLVKAAAIICKKCRAPFVARKKIVVTCTEVSDD